MTIKFPVRVDGIDIEVNCDIVAVDTARGAMQVRCWTAEHPKPITHGVDFRVEDGVIVAPKNEEEIVALVKGICPMAEFVRAKAVMPDLSYVTALVAPEPQAPQAPARAETPANTQTILPIKRA